MLLVHQLLLAELDLLFRVCSLKNVKVDSQLLFRGLAHVDVLEEPLIRLKLLVDDLELLTQLKLRLDRRLNGLDDLLR